MRRKYLKHVELVTALRTIGGQFRTILCSGAMFNSGTADVNHL